MSERKILVIDDEPAILKLLEKAFSKVGYSVFLAANAYEAFEILKQQLIPLIFIDLGLDSINGFHLCENIRRDIPQAIIFALTGYTGLYDPKQFIEAGFDGYFVKPISLKELYRAAKESFEKLNFNSTFTHPGSHSEF